MEFEAIKKFMDAMNLKLEIETNGVEYWGYIKTITISTKVISDKGIEYHTVDYYCKLSPKDVRFYEGQIFKDVNDGILTYLGDKKSVEKFLGQKKREKAREFFYKDI